MAMGAGEPSVAAGSRGEIARASISVSRFRIRVITGKASSSLRLRRERYISQMCLLTQAYVFRIAGLVAVVSGQARADESLCKPAKIC